MGASKLGKKGHNHILGLNIWLWLQNRAVFKATDWAAESRCRENISWAHEDMSQGRDARQEIDLKTTEEI